jgi:Immunoglobulin-like domain of bacterial spore germination
MSRHRKLALAATVLALSLVVMGCGSKSSSTSHTTTTTGPGSTTSTTSTSTTPPASAATDTAVWPFVTDSTRYRGPVQAAKGFAVKYLGFVDPVVGAFMQGDSRSGEVVIRPSSTGPETIVMVRKLAPDETWWVLGATTANLRLQAPTWNASIASPVTVSGRSTAFEATVNVEIRQDGTRTPLASNTVMGGSMGQIGPFSKAVSFSKPTAERGAIILKTLSAKDGNIAEATVLRIQFTGLPNVIKSALDTGNLSQLRPYLAHSVDYAIAASGAYGTISPDGAIKQLSYFKDDRGPWNFAIPATTLESFKSGSYRRYLGDDTYFGVSPAKGFMSVRVNSAGQIDQIFMAINTDLLK